MSLQSLPVRRLRQAWLLFAAAVLAVSGITLLAFLEVTLRKALELTDPWQVFLMFAATAATVAAFYRATGPHY